MSLPTERVYYNKESSWPQAAFYDGVYTVVSCTVLTLKQSHGKHVEEVRITTMSYIFHNNGLVNCKGSHTVQTYGMYVHTPYREWILVWDTGGKA